MKRTVWYVIGAVVGVVLLAAVGYYLFGRAVGYGYWGMMGSGRMHNWGFTPFGGISMLLMWLIPLLLLVFLGLGIAVLVRWTSTSRNGAESFGGQVGKGPSPKEIAQARYARGDITREEYQQLLEDLEG